MRPPGEKCGLGLHRFLHGKRAPRLEHLSYAVLGLGDSSYEHFNWAARDFDRRLAESGARRLVDRVDADIDYASAAETWRRQALEQAADLLPGKGARVVALPGVNLGGALRPARDNPYQANLLESRRITTAAAESDVRHLVLGVDPAVLRYRPGDSLGVWFHNEPALVEAVLRAVHLDGEESVTLGGLELPLRQALGERLELTRLHPSVVRGWAELAGDAGLSAVAGDSAELRAFSQGRQLIDLLAAYPASIDAATLANLLSHLQPRLYSIASSQDESEDEVHLTVSLVRYQARGREHLGGASGFLTKRLDEDDPLGVYVAENPAFRPPEDGDTPVILVGAGTGIAPYRSFLQHRAANGHSGRNWLVFGNRNFPGTFCTRPTGSVSAGAACCTGSAWPSPAMVKTRSTYSTACASRGPSSSAGWKRGLTCMCAVPPPWGMRCIRP